ncbi:hypothetical protein C0992_009220, partial [Termitomyces sp. T32_za158]
MSSDSWSPPTPTTRTPTAAPSARPSNLASGTPPVPGTGPSMTPHWTADWFSLMQQMQLTLAALERKLAALKSGHVIAAARTAAKRSNAPAARSTSNTPLAVPLAWDLPPTDGKVPRYECALELPDSLVAHVVGHQGRGLKQAHDLSGSRLAAFTQIGEALVVFGKRITKKRVRAPRKQQSGNAALAVAVPTPSGANASSTPKPPTLSAPPPPPMA